MPYQVQKTHKKQIHELPLREKANKQSKNKPTK